MKTKTKFDSTSDARNLINSVIEKFPKGPERDGLQTKLREFYNCFAGAMRLPKGYDRSKVIEEGTQNLHAAQRIADRVDKQNGNAKFSTMISILASNLTDLKRDHSKAGKVEDNFYGKRVVKGIFAKAKFAVPFKPNGMEFKTGGKFYEENKYRNAMHNIKNLSKRLESWVQKKYAEADVFLNRMTQNGGVTQEEKQRMDELIYGVQPYADSKLLSSRTGSKARFAVVGDIVKVRQGHKSVKGEIVKDNGDGTYMIELPNQLYSDGRKIIERVSEARLLLSRTGSKARFAKEFVLWAVPKGKTDTMYSQPIAEQLYTDAQINEVKRKATAAGWHTFRIDEVMSFEDMTNLWKGKPVKRRSSRTGAKAKFGWPESKFDIGDYVAIVGGSSNSVGKVSYTNYVDNKVDGGWKYKVIFPNGTMTFNEGSLKLAKPTSAAVSLIQARQ